MKRSFYDHLKRALDLTLVVPTFVASLPAQGLIALLVARHLGRPILFTQARPGMRGEIFTLVKFRTMRPLDPSRGWIDDETRLTTFGRTLRSTSLDELPTLWNVIVGDMTLVGPRPLLPQYLARYTPTQARRQDVRPGLTGLAQISGRNALDWEDRLRLDVQYVDRRCLKLDFEILLRTVGIVLSQRGVAAEGQATVAEFRGTPPPTPQCDRG